MKLLEASEVGEWGLSSRDLLWEGGGIFPATSCWGEEARGKAEAEAGDEAEAIGGAVVEAGRGEAMAAGASSEAMKEIR